MTTHRLLRYTQNVVTVSDKKKIKLIYAAKMIHVICYVIQKSLLLSQVICRGSCCAIATELKLQTNQPDIASRE